MRENKYAGRRSLHGQYIQPPHCRAVSLLRLLLLRAASTVRLVRFIH